MKIFLNAVHIRPCPHPPLILALVVTLSVHATCLGAASSSAAEGAAAYVPAADGGAVTTRVIPKHAVYSDPWVQQNVALSYAPESNREGLGAQAFEILGIFAIAKALGLPYLHAAPECVGHIGGWNDYQGKNCTNRMTAADQRKLARVKRLLQLPGSKGVTSFTTRSWHVERLDHVPLTWHALRNATEAALQHKRPTVMKLARVQSLLFQHPDVFLAVPLLKPAANWKKLPHHKPWLLRSVRVAVHMRRGDLTSNVHHLRRLLPAGFYRNIMLQLTQALEALGQDVVLELYTERPTTRRGRRELAGLRRTFPSINLLVGTDDLWNYQQMATADVLVLSMSMYSMMPALLNPNALVIAPTPQALDGKPISVLRMRHWFQTVDHNGTLPDEALQQLQQRYGALAGAPRQKKGTQPGDGGTAAAASSAA